MKDDFTNKSDVRPDQLAAIGSLFSGLPENFSERHRALTHIREAFHEELARVMEKPFNEYLAQLPQDSFTEKSQVAALANGFAKGLGLAVRCTRTNRPALIVADTQDADHSDISRFRFEVRNKEGRAIRTFTTRYKLPALSLMMDDSRMEFWTRRQHRSEKSR